MCVSSLQRYEIFSDYASKILTFSFFLMLAIRDKLFSLLQEALPFRLKIYALLFCSALVFRNFATTWRTYKALGIKNKWIFLFCSRFLVTLPSTNY